MESPLDWQWQRGSDYGNEDPTSTHFCQHCIAFIRQDKSSEPNSQRTKKKASKQTKHMDGRHGAVITRLHWVSTAKGDVPDLGIRFRSGFRSFFAEQRREDTRDGTTESERMDDAALCCDFVPVREAV